MIPDESYCFRIQAENIHGQCDPSIESNSTEIPKQKGIMMEKQGNNHVIQNI